MPAPVTACSRSSAGRRVWSREVPLVAAVALGAAAIPAVATAQTVGATPATVLRVHARSLDGTLQSLRTYLPIPLKPEAALNSLLGPLGGQVVLSAPADLVVALDRKNVDNPAPPYWVFACTLRSLDEARKAASAANLAMDS